MKTARFANMVETAGKPDPYLLFVSPEKDKTLQKAIKANKVLTVHQAAVGNKTDHGEVGFEAGKSRQYLIFPKSLTRFRCKRIVGIKYDLLDDTELPKGKRAGRPSPPKSPRVPKPSRPAKKKKSSKPVKQKRKEDPSEHKVVHFPKQERHRDEDKDDEIEAIKDEVRHAMEVLESGKQVAAFNLLKRIVGD